MSQESTAHVKSQKKLQYAEAITLFRNCILLHNLKPRLSMKMLSINNFTTELLTIIDYFLNGLQSLRSLLTSLIAKLLIDNISIERLTIWVPERWKILQISSHSQQLDNFTKNGIFNRMIYWCRQNKCFDIFLG